MRPGRKIDNDDAPEALFLHCLTVYNMMVQEATLVSSDTEDEMLVWTGMLTNLITGQCNLSIPYYTKITKALKEMGSIRQLKRGGGTTPSQWELLVVPTADLYDGRTPPKLVPVGRYEQLRGQLNALSDRVNFLEKALAKFLEEAQEAKNGQQ